MSSNNILRFGVPIVSQASQKVGATGVRHQTGQCGIEPYKPTPVPPPKAPEKLPDHLMRPPCMPGSQEGRFPPDCKGMRGLYCPPERPKFKYPPFSENIEFVPSGQTECWWTKPQLCDLEEDGEEDLPMKL